MSYMENEGTDSIIKILVLILKVAAARWIKTPP